MEILSSKSIVLCNRKCSDIFNMPLVGCTRHLLNDFLLIVGFLRRSCDCYSSGVCWNIAFGLSKQVKTQVISLHFTSLEFSSQQFNCVGIKSIVFGSGLSDVVNAVSADNMTLTRLIANDYRCG